MALRVFKAVASFAKPRIFGLSAGSPGGFQWQPVRIRAHRRWGRL